jgi:SH3-like domain-containing protein
MRRPLALLSLFLAIPLAPVAAQDRDVPYWATLRATEVNMRVGPSEDFPIAWVYRRVGLPVKVLRVREGWRLVQDPDGERGWIIARLLNPKRGAIVKGNGLAELREGPAGERVLWRAEPGVVGKLGDCDDDWCQFDAGGRKGWVRAERLWGAGEP